MNTDKTLHTIKKDLRKITLKELVDVIRQINIALKTHIPSKGRKDDVIERLAYFVFRLVAADKANPLNIVTRIANETTNKKLTWKYENNQLLFKLKHLPTTFIPEPEELAFKPSPFFSPVTKLCSIKICPISSNVRQTRRFQFNLSDDDRRLLATPGAMDERSPYQIRFYCARFDGEYSDLSVEFPAVCELKVNDTTLSNSLLRCLKGKPGTVNPPDITIMTRKRETNNIELIYINNKEAFIATAFLVKRTAVPELVNIMKNESLLSKEEVLTKLEEKQEEEEIIMESETLSMKDPLVFTRINIPTRSKTCNHLQCFDANIFLTMNEQTPTWSCPVCYKRIDDWKDLVVDGYFQEILSSTPKHISSVLVESNGNITIIDENPDLANQDEEEEEEDLQDPMEREVITIVLDDDDDELVEPTTVNEISSPNIIHENIPTTIDTAKRTPSSTDEQPQKKKQKQNVIDLTLDSDNENVAELSSRESTIMSDEQQTIGNAIHDAENDNDIDKDSPTILPHYGTLYQEKIPFSENEHDPSASNLNVQ